MALSALTTKGVALDSPTTNSTAWKSRSFSRIIDIIPRLKIQNQPEEPSIINRAVIKYCSIASIFTTKLHVFFHSF